MGGFFNYIGSLFPTLGSFWMWTWPLIALPLIIHLINQRRHRTVEWGAMMFLLTAQKMSRGMAVIRHVLIMGARMLAIAALIYAVSRPLATGWFASVAGGKSETILVLLDRSASMNQQSLTTGETKLDAGLSKITSMLSVFDDSQQIVLIESAENRAIEIPSSKALLDYPKVKPTESTADISSMLETALKYIKDNESGSTDIWICSDGRVNDWDPESSRWDAFRSECAKLDRVQINVLNYGEKPTANYSVVVGRAERKIVSGNEELNLDIEIRRSDDLTEEENLQLEFYLNSDDAKTVQEIRVDQDVYSIKGLRLPLESKNEAGWGKVVLPADTNMSDNVFYFSYANLPTLKTVIVSDSEFDAEALALVVEAPMLQDRKYEAEIVRTDQMNEIDWNAAALILWHAPLPVDQVARQVMNFVESGRSIIFFPPEEIGDSNFNGMSWGDWQSSEESEKVSYWRPEDGLLMRGNNGSALTVDKIDVFKHCSLNGDSRTLAQLEGGDKLLAQQTSDAGGIYFMSTLPTINYSTLQQDGYVIFTMCHRALNAGATAIGKAKQLLAGTSASTQVAQCNMDSGNHDVLSESRPFCSGVYSGQEQVIALNRPPAEDSAKPMTDEEIEKLFGDLRFNMVADEVGSDKAIASETWKWFIGLMGLALLAEAILCLPAKPEPRVELDGRTGLNVEVA